MKIISSHLAMRFYRVHGWSKELLESCLMDRSKLCFREDILFDDVDMCYWVLEIYSKFDLEKLKPHITEIYDYKGNQVSKDDWDAFLKEYNW